MRKIRGTSLHQHEKGFTLIEMLIVVAILGVLSSVAIPNLSKFIGSGRTQASDVELKIIQMTTDIMMIDNGVSTLDNGSDLTTSDMSQVTVKSGAHNLTQYLFSASFADDGKTLKSGNTYIFSPTGQVSPA